MPGGGKSAFFFHVLYQNTLIFAWEEGQARAKNSPAHEERGGEV